MWPPAAFTSTYPALQDPCPQRCRVPVGGVELDRLFHLVGASPPLPHQDPVYKLVPQARVGKTASWRRLPPSGSIEASKPPAPRHRRARHRSPGSAAREQNRKDHRNATPHQAPHERAHRSACALGSSHRCERQTLGTQQPAIRRHMGRRQQAHVRNGRAHDSLRCDDRRELPFRERSARSAAS